MRELTPPASISQMYTVLVRDKAAFSGERSPFHSGFARKASCWSLLMRLLLAGNFISYSLAIEIILSSRGWGWFLQLYRRIFRVKLGLWGISRHTHSNGNSNKCSNRIKCGDQKTYPWCLCPVAGLIRRADAADDAPTILPSDELAGDLHYHNM